MNRLLHNILTGLLGLAGVVCLLTGVQEFEYSFRTGRWSVAEMNSPFYARVAGILLIAFAVFFARRAPKR